MVDACYDTITHLMTLMMIDKFIQDSTEKI